MMTKIFVASLIILAVSVVLLICHLPRAAASSESTTVESLNAQFRELIDAENRHDLDAVGKLLWDSPNTLFVAKTATAAEGGWAGFWGRDVVLEHFRDLYRGTFVMRPDYTKARTVLISRDVGETYAPLTIAVSYAGQTGQPRPFLIVVTWVKTPAGWKMATDIAIPVPATATPEN